MEMLAIENYALMDCIRSYPAVYDKKLQWTISKCSQYPWLAISSGYRQDAMKDQVVALPLDICDAAVEVVEDVRYLRV